MSAVQAKAGPPASGIELMTGSNLSPEKLSPLDELMRQAAAELGETIFAAKAAAAEIKFSGISAGKASDMLGGYAESIASSAILSNQWDGTGLAGIDRDFLASLVDTLFGSGLQQPFRAERPLTNVETKVVNWFFAYLASVLSKCFRTLADVNFDAGPTDYPPAFERVGRPSTTVIVAGFELVCGQTTGKMFLALPQGVMVFLRAFQPREEPPAPKGADPSWSRSLGSRLSRASLQVKATLGSIELSLGEIARLQPGQIIKLDTLAQNRVRLDCNGQALYWCRLTQGGNTYTLNVEDRIDTEQEFIDDILSA